MKEQKAMLEWVHEKDRHIDRIGMRAKRKKRGGDASNSRSSVRVEGSGSIPR